MNPPSTSLPAQVRVGTIGFSYSDWQPAFYPADARPTDLLAAYASAFDTLELDTTFYGIPPADRAAKWASAVPPGFLFCPKTPRLITHDAPLSAGLSSMQLFLASLAPMHQAGKLGPILIQFPPTFARQKISDLGVFLKNLPLTHRYAVELRHASWLHPATTELLSARRCAWVGGDYSVDLWPLHATTDFVYLRLVGRHHRFPTYERERLDPTPRLEHWLTRLRPLLPAHIAINHSLPSPESAIHPLVFTLIADDFAGHAPATANRFRRLVHLPTPMPTNGRPPSAQQSLF